MERSQLLREFADKKPVLDHGFLRLVDVMGDDGAIVEAARMSTTGKRSPHKWADPVPEPLHDRPERARHTCTVCGYSCPSDRPSHWQAILDSFAKPTSIDGVCLEADFKLIDSMMRRGHTSPFEMCEIKLHVKLPIFVARQWIRHRTWSFNEFSGRYSEMKDETFAVSADGWRMQDTVNRQGSAGVVTNYPPMSSDWVKNGGQESRWGVAVPGRKGGFQGPDTVKTAGEYLSYRQWEVQDHAREVYEERIAFGVSKEMARIDLPLSQYTEWMCKVDLHNLFHFLKLRLDEHAQPEIRVYAEAIAEIVKVWCPLAWMAFEKHKLNAITLSATERETLRAMLAPASGQAPDPAHQALLKRLGAS